MKICLFIYFILISCLLNGQITTWHGPAGFASDKYYQVKVNGMNVPVYDTPIASYAIFDFKDEVDVEISTMFDVRWVDIRPTRLNITPQYCSDNSFSFHLKRPENVSVELNGRIRQQPLFIFSGNPEQLIPVKKDKNVITFESGKLYKNVKLELQDDQTVHIEGGAVVQGYIYAKGKRNIKVTGRGILDGTFNNLDSDNHNRFLSFENCKNVMINGIVLHNGTTWQIALYNNDSVNIDGVHIVSEFGSDDGIDIVACKNVMIANVFIHTKDDCIAIKSFGDSLQNKITSNIQVKNSVLWNSIYGNGLEIGYELCTPEVKNIRFENIDIIHVEDGAAMSIHNAGQANVHDIIFNNIRIEDATQKLFDVAVFFSQWSPEVNYNQKLITENYMHGAWDGVQKIEVGTEAFHEKYRGTIRNVAFRNIQVIGGVFPFSSFYGFSSNKNVSNITIENLTYLGQKIKDVRKAKIRCQNTSYLKLN